MKIESVNYGVEFPENKPAPASPRLKDCTEAEFDAFLKAYPRKLERDVYQVCEPPMVSFNDFTLGDWPKSIVAGHSFEGRDSLKPANWKIAEG